MSATGVPSHRFDLSQPPPPHPAVSELTWCLIPGTQQHCCEENDQRFSRAGAPLVGRVGSDQGEPVRPVVFENLPTRSVSFGTLPDLTRRPGDDPVKSPEFVARLDNVNTQTIERKDFAPAVFLTDHFFTVEFLIGGKSLVGVSQHCDVT